VRCFTDTDNLPSRCSLLIALGYDPSWFVVIEDGGQWRIVVSAFPGNDWLPCCSPVRQQEVDQPAMLVDSTEQVLPLAADLHIRPVHAPRGRSVSLVSPDPLLQLRRVALDPTHDRGRVYLHTALLHHLPQIAIGDPVLAVPANTHQDDLNRKTTTLEHERFLDQPLHTTTVFVNATEPTKDKQRYVLPMYCSAHCFHLA